MKSSAWFAIVVAFSCAPPGPTNVCGTSVVCPAGTKCAAGFCIPPCRTDADCATGRCEADHFCAAVGPPGPAVPADCYYLDTRTLACEVSTFDPVLNPLANRCPTGFSLCGARSAEPTFLASCAQPIGRGFFASLVAGSVPDVARSDQVGCGAPVPPALPALVGCGARTLDNKLSSVALATPCGGYSRAAWCGGLGLDCPGGDVRLASGNSPSDGILCCQ